jgi:hypothetical protein
MTKRNTFDVGHEPAIKRLRGDVERRHDPLFRRDHIDRAAPRSTVTAQLMGDPSYSRSALATYHRQQRKLAA